MNVFVHSSCPGFGIRKVAGFYSNIIYVWMLEFALFESLKMKLTFGVSKRTYLFFLCLQTSKRQKSKELKYVAYVIMFCCFLAATKTTKQFSSPGLLGRRLGVNLMMGFSNKKLR